MWEALDFPRPYRETFPMKKLLLVSLLTLPLFSFADTSESERGKNKWEITVQAGGDYRMTPTQGSVMYHLDQDTLIGFKGGTDRESNESQTSFALQSKHYTGNSFYVAPEIFYLNTNEDVDWFISDIFNIKSEYARYISMGVGVRIGNQWTWDTFTLGCDWIGVGRRVGTWRKDTDNLSDTTVTVLNVIAGVSF